MTRQNPDTDILSAESTLVQTLGAPVPVENITAELIALWSSNATDTRCSLINFVVYSEQPNSLARNAALLGDITSDHACRALVIEARRSPAAEVAPSVKAWITAHCHLDQAGGKSLCSEQIAFLLTGDPVKLVPNTVFAHLDSDLPLAFWWQGEFSDAFERHLTSRIDRLIIDSASWSNPEREFEILQQTRRQSGSRFVVLDLVSTRLFTHRLALAACFDTPETLAGLDRVREITISHSDGQRFTALAFAAWMALKADWKMGCPCAGDAIEMTTAGNQRITLNFARKAVNNCCSGISDVVLTGDDIHISLSIDATGRHVQSQATVGGHTPVACLTPVAARGESLLISHRLRQPANDALYFRVWNRLMPCL